MLTPTQEAFVHWNAERLGIAPEESRERYLRSWCAVRGGHRGRDFRRFNVLSHDLFQVFFSDKETEIQKAYRHHGPMHFLRMLSYREPVWGRDDFVFREMAGRSGVDILDYGCGLAQDSRSLARALKGEGVETSLFLVDIPTLRRDFLLWLGEETGIETTFLEATPENPLPELPRCDACFAAEFFEHVHDPLRYFDHHASPVDRTDHKM